MSFHPAITRSEQEGFAATLLCAGAWDSLEYPSGGGQRLYYNSQPLYAPHSTMDRYLNHVIDIYSDKCELFLEGVVRADSVKRLFSMREGTDARRHGS